MGTFLCLMRRRIPSRSILSLPRSARNVNLPRKMTRICWVAGSGAYEGEGFLAPIHGHTREALWILYFELAEKFILASSSAGTVHATSEEYPFSFQWRIVASRPPEVTGIRTHAA